MMPASQLLLINLLSSRLEFLYYLLMKTYEADVTDAQVKTSGFVEQHGSQPTAVSNEDDRVEPSPQSTTYLWNIDWNSPALRRRSGHRPNTSSTAYFNFCRFLTPQPASDASNSQAPCQSSEFSSRNCPLEPSLSIRQLCLTDSLARLSCGQTFDLNVNVVEANINMHNASPVVEEEACTDVDIALLSSLGSEGGVSMNSICWKSMVSVSSPEEMRLHGPLPVRSTKDTRASSKVHKLRCARKKQAHWSLQQASELYAPTTFEQCVGYATCVRQPRRSHKRKSNLKKSTIGVTAPCQVDAISIPIWGDDIYRCRSTLSTVYRILRRFYCLHPSKPG